MHVWIDYSFDKPNPTHRQLNWIGYALVVWCLTLKSNLLVKFYLTYDFVSFRRRNRTWDPPYVEKNTLVNHCVMVVYIQRRSMITPLLLVIFIKHNRVVHTRPLVHNVTSNCNWKSSKTASLLRNQTMLMYAQRCYALWIQQGVIILLF